MNDPRVAMLCRTKCGEDGTLQESITLAKVQQIDMVDQQNGSHGCNGRCDAWCSRSRTSDCQSCIVASSMRLETNWITGSSKVFDLSISLRSCRHFSSFLSFSRASTLGCVLLSFCQNSSSALSFAVRFVFGLAFAFPLPSFVCWTPLPSRWAAPGVVKLFELSTWENSCNYLTRRV